MTLKDGGAARGAAIGRAGITPVRIGLEQRDCRTLARAASRTLPDPDSPSRGCATETVDPVMEFALSVARGLSHAPRRLDCRFLYDDRGSEIFERICEQPEYYLTRTEGAILAAAAADIAERTGKVRLIELGSGSSLKTRLVLAAYLEAFGEARYTPVDVSSSILELARQELAVRLPGVEVEPIHGTYEEAFPLLPELSPSLMLFLGSTAGNLDNAEADAFWSRIATYLAAGDFCLLGVDITTDINALNAAYNDAAGYSAAFTRNLFERMNRELGAGVDTAAVEHDAVYNREWRRVEIFARFSSEQVIEIAPLGRRFQVAAGERVLTEISRKFSLSQIVPYLATFGLAAQQIYSDADQHFAVLLLQRV